MEDCFYNNITNVQWKLWLLLSNFLNDQHWQAFNLKLSIWSWQYLVLLLFTFILNISGPFNYANQLGKTV